MKNGTKYIITALVVVYVILPITIATLTLKVPLVERPRLIKKYTAEEVYEDISQYWVKHADELIVELEPLIDLVTNPSEAAEILEKELHIDVSKIDVAYVLERAKELKKSKIEE